LKNILRQSLEDHLHKDLLFATVIHRIAPCGLWDKTRQRLEMIGGGFGLLTAASILLLGRTTITLNGQKVAKELEKLAAVLIASKHRCRIYWKPTFSQSHQPKLQICQIAI
jgi:hypothetical protein